MIKGHQTEKKLEAMSKLSDVIVEVSSWSSQFGNGIENWKADQLHDSLVFPSNSFTSQGSQNCMTAEKSTFVLPRPLFAAADSASSTPNVWRPVIPLQTTQLMPQEQNLGKPLQAPMHDDDSRGMHSKFLMWLLMISLICRLDMLQQDFQPKMFRRQALALVLPSAINQTQTSMTKTTRICIMFRLMKIALVKFFSQVIIRMPSSGVAAIILGGM